MFESGSIAMLVVGLIVAELLLVAIYAASRPARRHLCGLLPTIAAGGLLALALYVREAYVDWRVGASLLGLSGLMHLLDMTWRWRGRNRP